MDFVTASTAQGSPAVLLSLRMLLTKTNKFSVIKIEFYELPGNYVPNYILDSSVLSEISSPVFFQVRIPIFELRCGRRLRAKKLGCTHTLF